MSERGGIVFLHGHGRYGASMAMLRRAAHRSGYATLSPSYPYRRSLSEIVEWLAPRMARFAAGLDGPLHVVTHSLGGLVARAYLAEHRPERLGRIVLLAPPNAGSELADLLFRLGLARLALGRSGAHLRTHRSAADEASLGSVGYPVGIIAGSRSLLPVPGRFLPGPHDGKVSIAATHVAGETAHITLPVSHTLMVYDRGVIREALTFLEHGAFAHGHLPDPAGSTAALGTMPG